MKERINPAIKWHHMRGMFYVLLLALAVCVIPFALAQQKAAKLRHRVERIDEKGHAFPTNIIVVTNTDDSGPGSLRDALAIANDGDTIDATGVSGTIFLTSGELQITHNLTINGPGAGSLAVNGNGTSRVFDNIVRNVTISGLSITNGSVTNGGGGGIFNDGGNSATLALNNCTVTGNDAEFGGGIVNMNGTLMVSNCTISNNGGIFGGGGISNSAFDGIATLIITNSTISGNSAGDYGGGIANVAAGSVTATASVTVSNGTLSGNSVLGEGGAIANRAPDVGNFATLMITNSTISNNSATADGGGINNEDGAELELGGTILKEGTSGENIFNAGTATSLGYNLSSDDGGGVLTGLGDQINTDPMLGSLENNGGPTFTHALLPGSPAIDAGDPSFTPPPFFDQRGPGFDRVINGFIDKGSFEVQGGGMPSLRPTPTPRPRPTHAPR